MPATLMRLTETYNIADNKERAQTTLWFLSSAGTTPSEWAAELTPFIDDRWEAQRSLHSTNLHHASSRLDLVNVANGHLINGVDLDNVSAPAGTSGTDSLPPEVCEVLTLRTDLSGPSFRGRIYLPCFSVQGLAADGNMEVTQQHQAVDAFAAFFDAIWGGAIGAAPVVYSRKEHGTTPIRSIDMGSVFDVQRSRRRSMVETRYSVAVG